MRRNSAHNLSTPMGSTPSAFRRRIEAVRGEHLPATPVMAATTGASSVNFPLREGNHYDVDLQPLIDGLDETIGVTSPISTTAARQHSTMPLAEAQLQSNVDQLASFQLPIATPSVSQANPTTARRYPVFQTVPTPTVTQTSQTGHYNRSVRFESTMPTQVHQAPMPNVATNSNIGGSAVNSTTTSLPTIRPTEANIQEHPLQGHFDRVYDYMHQRLGQMTAHFDGRLSTMGANVRENASRIGQIEHRIEDTIATNCPQGLHDIVDRINDIQANLAQANESLARVELLTSDVKTLRQEVDLLRYQVRNVQSDSITKDNPFRVHEPRNMPAAPDDDSSSSSTSDSNSSHRSKNRRSKNKSRETRSNRSKKSKKIAHKESSKRRFSSSDSDESAKSKNSSSSSDESSSKDDVPIARLHRQTRGKRESGLPELTPSDTNFKEIMSYRRYRLIDTNPNEGRSVTRKAGTNTRRAKSVFGGREFDGSQPLKIFQFLKTVQKFCNENKIAEGAALQLLPSLLSGEAADEFDKNRNLSDDPTEDIQSYPQAINFLLSTYAKDLYLERTLEELDNISQQRNETEVQYAGRLKELARLLGNIFSQHNLITRFLRGIMAPIKPELMLMHTTTVRFKTLKSAIDAATQLGEAHRISSQELNENISRQARLSTSPRRGNIRTVSAVRSDIPNVPVDGSDRYIGHETPSQINTVNPYPPADPKPRVPQSHRDICFKCFKGGHMKPNCTLADPSPGDATAIAEFSKIVENNYFLLSEYDKQQLRDKGVNPFKPYNIRLRNIIPRSPVTGSPVRPRELAPVNQVENVSDTEPSQDPRPVGINVLHIIPRPSIIPPGKTVEQFKADPVCPLSFHNYKVNASIGLEPTKLSQKLTVLDTGAGPNVIKLTALQPDSDIEAMPMPMKLTTASGDDLPTLGVINLYVKINTYVCQQPFVVVDSLSADVLLGATFIQQHVNNIWIRRRSLVLVDGTTAPIQLRTQSDVTSNGVNYITVPTRVPETPLRVCKNRRLNPYTECMVEAQIPKHGTFLLEPSQRFYESSSSSVANGICTVEKNKPFMVKVANMSHRPIHVRKNQIIGHAIVAPIWAYQFDITPEGPNLSTGKLVDLHNLKEVDVSRLPLNEGGIGMLQTNVVFYSR